jgi:cyclopropane fatty-acyl-phospholipid synthase-like methyltransferase
MARRRSIPCIERSARQSGAGFADRKYASLVSDTPARGFESRIREAREPLHRTFDSAADLYDAARPAYPDELLDDLIKLAELRRGARLLEIGCATGKTTRSLLERGFSIVCVEMGAQLAERAPSAAGLARPSRRRSLD